MRSTLKIMGFLFRNPEKYNENDLKKRFGENKFREFSFFCLGGSEAYADDRGEGNTFRLLQEGIREYHRLKQEHQQFIFNLFVVFFTSILALFSILNFLFK